MTRLPVPIFRKDKEPHTMVEIIKPTSGVLADTHDILEKTGDEYAAIGRMVAGCLGSVGNIEDPVHLREAALKLTYRTAEFVAIQGLLLTTDDDGIDGSYPCPVNGCDGVHSANIENDSDGHEILNTLDYVKDFPIKYLQGEDGGDTSAGETFHHTLRFPVDLKDGKELLEEITSLDFSYPTLQDCQVLRKTMSAGNPGRFQLKLYGNSITSVSGAEPGETLKTWKSRFSYPVMQKLDIRDLKSIYDKGREWGYQTEKDRLCPVCDKMWKDRVNPMGFFSSALRATA